MIAAITAVSLLTFGSAPGDEVAPFRIPSEFTEAELVQALVPDYEKRLRENPLIDKEEPGRYFASVAATLETDFGLKGRRFLVVEVQGSRGVCAQCPFRHVGVFDLATKAKLFEHSQEGMGPEAELEVFPLWKDDPVLCLAFQTGAANLNMGGSFQSTQEWYRPSNDASGAVSFVRVWSGLSRYSTADNSSWLAERACGWTTPTGRDSKTSYVYRRRSFFSTPASAEQSAAAATKPATEWNNGEDCDCGDCGVEIRLRETWIRSAHGLLRRVRTDLQRIDHSAVKAFPFDLPARAFRATIRPDRSQWKQVEGQYEIPSPSGRLSIQWKESERQTVRIVSSDGMIREIRFFSPEFVRNHFGSITAFGWSDDESRILVVVALQNAVGMLLSYEVRAGRDACVRLLGDVDSWSDGFVLKEVSRPSRTKR